MQPQIISHIVLAKVSYLGMKFEGEMKFNKIQDFSPFGYHDLLCKNLDRAMDSHIWNVPRKQRLPAHYCSGARGCELKDKAIRQSLYEILNNREKERIR